MSDTIEQRLITIEDTIREHIQKGDWEDRRDMFAYVRTVIGEEFPVHFQTIRFAIEDRMVDYANDAYDEYVAKKESGVS